jgi:DNA replication protein DnaC
LSERLQAVAERISAEADMSPEEQRRAREVRERARCEAYNEMQGRLKDGYTTSTIHSESTFIEGDGYDCPLCLNRGDTMVLEERNGMLYPRHYECKCMGIRRSIWRMKASGLEKSIKDYTFKRFDVREPWQQKLLDMAQRYLAEGVKAGRWLYVGGQPGCGKTHVCTAVVRELLYEMPVIYAVWPQTSRKLKAIVNDAGEYEDEVGRLQEVDMLYLDDFFKPVAEANGIRQPPTPADMRLAFDILNHRYVNRKPTILSGEWYISELADIDEAIASRIAEQCGEFSMTVSRDRARNHRLTMSTVV